ncbi:3,4-dihydroxy-2-butanone-4-phosphate synthase [Actinomycetospora chiangmaiensis]|uniref:3,4-dihydroxy-2-butanone-4-phosphate synthase n=1 Tax=Actinomycetospora chiangmaiensis TaxID=402650 RepID=UPI0003A47573|nr:3,4-dihydroxy-2-butanone-4-phosphate synthase [Actinomycetospora chiangmaiensis]
MRAANPVVLEVPGGAGSAAFLVCWAGHGSAELLGYTARVAGGPSFLAVSPATPQATRVLPVNHRPVACTIAERAEIITSLAGPGFDADTARRAGIPVVVADAQGTLGAAPGIAEFAVDLVQAAGLGQLALVTEIVLDDGAGPHGLDDLATRRALVRVTGQEIIAERLRTQALAVRGPEVVLPTDHGLVLATGYRDPHTGAEHLVLRGPATERSARPVVHVHRECPTGDLFSSLSCSCRSELDAALVDIAGSRSGIVMYLRGKPGRPLHHGPHLDDRQAHLLAFMLQDLSVPRIQLHRSDPQQRAALTARGIPY